MFEYSSDDLKDNFFDTADAIADSIPKFVEGDEKLVEGLTEYLLPFFDYVEDRYNPTAEWDYDEDEIDEEFPNLQHDRKVAMVGLYQITKKLRDEQWNEYIVEIFRDKFSSLFQRYISELEERATDFTPLLTSVALAFEKCNSKEAFGCFKVFRALKPSEPFAYYWIGTCYHEGIGVPQNFKKALAYMSIAISLGHAHKNMLTG